MLRSIGQLARGEMEGLLDRQVNLQLGQSRRTGANKKTPCAVSVTRDGVLL